MKRRRIRKVLINPLKSDKSKKPVTVTRNPGIKKRPIASRRSTENSEFVITPALYYNNEDFYNNLPTDDKRLSF